MPKKKTTDNADLIKGFTLLALKKYKHVNEQTILGKLIALQPEVKKQIPEIKKEIAHVIKAYQKLSPAEREKEAKRYAIKIPAFAPRGREGELPELKKVPFPYVFRFEPSPTGPLHIGHTIVLLLNAEYAKKYNGKLVIRIADTNPEDIYEPAYAMIIKDAEWITQQKVIPIIQSSRMEDYYLHAKTLIDQGHAYVCTCTQEAFKELITQKKPCPCRNLSAAEQKERWEKMFEGYEMGDAVLRIKTDIKHKNPAVRDWPAFRINDAPHPRLGEKYRVWPLMNFAIAVDDHDNQISHVIRGKDHLVNMERQMYVFKYLQWDIPEYIHIGRINFKGLKVSASGFREGIENKLYSGWDDPRLPTVAAFKRRGFHPGAFARYVRELGPSKVDKTVNYEEFIKAIYAYDRVLIDKDTHRYFFIENPKEITIANAPQLKVEVPIHPDVPAHGMRHFSTAGKFYIEDELEKGKVYRFMHLFNFKDKNFHSIELQPKLNAKLIHWLPVSSDLVNVNVIMPDTSVKKGCAEHAITNAQPGEVVQFERKFFCKFDRKEGNISIFYYTHP